MYTTQLKIDTSEANFFSKKATCKLKLLQYQTVRLIPSPYLLILFGQRVQVMHTHRVEKQFQLSWERSVVLPRCPLGQAKYELLKQGHLGYLKRGETIHFKVLFLVLNQFITRSNYLLTNMVTNYFHQEGKRCLKYA